MVDVFMPWFLPRQAPEPKSREPRETARQSKRDDGRPADARAEKPEREPVDYPGYFLG